MVQSQQVCVALLRGINVGGKNLLPMKELARMFSSGGCSGVNTYIQSGNVVFCADQKLRNKLPAMVSDEIARRFAFHPEVIVRTMAQMGEILAHNPFLKPGVDERTLAVTFLRDAPTAEQIAGLDPDRSPPDKFVVRGAEIYMQFPNGMGRTKLTSAYFDSRLKTTGTARNWRTTLTLYEMMKAL